MRIPPSRGRPGSGPRAAEDNRRDLEAIRAATRDLDAQVNDARRQVSDTRIARMDGPGDRDE